MTGWNDERVTDLTLRQYRESDRDALASICLRTGDAGADATGQYRHASLLGDVYAVPYAERHPDLCFIVDRDGEAVGYVLGTDDTDAFNAWFRDRWWPSVARRYDDVRADERDAGVIAGAERVGTAAVPYAERMPAHLHIDLLPDAQGGGWGRRLIAAFEDALRARGVPGVHFVAAASNAGALAFYDRLGFERLPSPDGAQAFGRLLATDAGADGSADTGADGSADIGGGGSPDVGADASAHT